MSANEGRVRPFRSFRDTDSRGSPHHVSCGLSELMVVSAPLSSGRVSSGCERVGSAGAGRVAQTSSSFLVVVAMPPSVRSRRSGAAGGALGVCREVIFVVFFGRGEVTPTTPLVGP